jgi:hypothetical protein
MLYSQQFNNVFKLKSICLAMEFCRCPYRFYCTQIPDMAWHWCMINITKCKEQRQM